MPTTHHHQSSRRTFVNQCIHSTAAIALSPTLFAASRAQAAPQNTEPTNQSPGWIDAHVHVWTPNTEEYPLGSKFSIADMQPPSFTAAELLSHCRPAGVERIVLIQMVFYHYDHSYMVHAMKTHPGVFSGVALIDHHSPQIAQRVQELKASGMRGFRLHSLGDADKWVNDAGMHDLWRLAAEQGLAICPLINPTDIRYIDALCEKFPETTVVVDHFARIGVSGTIEPEPLDALCRLSRFPKVHLKTSAFYALGKKAAPYEDLIPMIRRVFDCFGPERLMWGSDCPYQVQGEYNYESSIALIRDSIDFLSPSDRHWLLRGTAEKIFFA